MHPSFSRGFVECQLDSAGERTGAPRYFHRLREAIIGESSALVRSNEHQTVSNPSLMASPSSSRSITGWILRGGFHARYGIDVPPEVMQVLRWHVDTQLVTPEQKDSDLLFPAVTGGFRAVTALCKPFDSVAEAMKLGFTFTPRGMRRTFNDLARTACIEAVVTRSISGHLTERMQEHYSTVRGPEQREGIAKVVDLMTRRKKDAAGV